MEFSNILQMLHSGSPRAAADAVRAVTRAVSRRETISDEVSQALADLYDRKPELQREIEVLAARIPNPALTGIVMGVLRLGDAQRQVAVLECQALAVRLASDPEFISIIRALALDQKPLVAFWASLAWARATHWEDSTAVECLATAIVNYDQIDPATSVRYVCAENLTTQEAELLSESLVALGAAPIRGEYGLGR